MSQKAGPSFLGQFEEKCKCHQMTKSSFTCYLGYFMVLLEKVCERLFFKQRDIQIARLWPIEYGQITRTVPVEVTCCEIRTRRTRFQDSYSFIHCDHPLLSIAIHHSTVQLPIRGQFHSLNYVLQESSTLVCPKLVIGSHTLE